MVLYFLYSCIGKSYITICKERKFTYVILILTVRNELRISLKLIVKTRTTFKRLNIAQRVSWS